MKTTYRIAGYTCIDRNNVWRIARNRKKIAIGGHKFDGYWFTRYDRHTFSGRRTLALSLSCCMRGIVDSYVRKIIMYQKCCGVHLLGINFGVVTQLTLAVYHGKYAIFSALFNDSAALSHSRMARKITH